MVHVVSTLVPVNTPTVASTVSPPYRGPSGSVTYPPTTPTAAMGLAVAALTSPNCAGGDAATGSPAYAAVTVTLPLPAAANWAAATVYEHVPTPAADGAAQVTADATRPVDSATAAVSVSPAAATVGRPSASRAT